MRVALFTDAYLPDINGVVSSVELLRKKLEEKGHDAYVVSTYPGLFKVKTEGKIIRLPGIELKSLYGYKAASPVHYLILDELEKLNLDLIHVHTEFGVGIFAGTVAKHLHIPLVRTYHTTYEDYTHYANPFNLESWDKMAKKAVAVLSKQYGDSCIRLISPSKKTAEMLHRYGIKTPIEIIPTGVEIDRFNPERTSRERIDQIHDECHIADNEKMILYVGRIAEEKSIEILIDAFAILKEKQVPCKLVVVGGGPQLDELMETVSKRNLNDKIIFLNKRPFDEVPAYYHAADAFTSASITETQGMTYIEALASGLPVFARYDEVLSGLVEEGKDGYLFNNETELAQKIEDWMSIDESTCQIMRQQAISYAGEYDADLFVERILKVYNDAIHDYDSSYVVERISLKNDYVTLKLSASHFEEEELLVSLDTLYELGIRKGDKLSATVYDKLKSEEEETKAYRSTLKAIAGKDYTVKQMYDYISRKYELPIEQVNDIIDKLISRGLLDDRKYALEKIESFNSMFYSRKKMINKLRQDGVSVEVIEEVLEEDRDAEKSNALKMAQKFHASIHGKTVPLTKQTVLRKLVSAGFEYSDAQSAIESLDFSKEAYDEEDLLKKEGNKAKKRLEKKYQGTELRNRVYHALASKGFRTEAIYAYLNEMEWNND